MKKEEIDSIVTEILKRPGEKPNPYELVRMAVAEIQKRQKPAAEVELWVNDFTRYSIQPAVDFSELPEGTKLFTFPPAEQKGECKVPDGWQVVPKEPTPAMICAGNDGFRSQDSMRHTVSSCYRAMLSVAPKPSHAEDPELVTHHCPVDGTTFDMMPGEPCNWCGEVA